MAGPSLNSFFSPFKDAFLSATSQAGKLPGASRLAKFAELPGAVFSDTLATSASLVLNHLIAQQRSTSEKLAKEAGKVVLFDVSPIRVAFRVSNEGLFQVSRQSGSVKAPADTTIAMEWSDLIGSVSSPSSISKRASISGDMDFAQAVSSAILDLHWDPENDLARVVGDAQAVWIMNSLSQAGIGLKDLLARLKSNLREYAVFEKELTPSADEFDEFKQGINTLRDDLARLEKRLKKMEDQ